MSTTRSMIRGAARTASHCVKCSRALTLQEPIWRGYAALGYGPFGRWSRTVAPYCEQCASTWRGFAPGKPCEHCGRTVHNKSTHRRRSRTFCGERCEEQAASTSARQKRAEARTPRPCQCCGETFEPARADLVYCSPACRQQAYRRRVTAAECLGGGMFENRNGDDVLHMCEQCCGEPDGQERLRLIGTGDDAEEVWLHPQCWSFWCGYRGAVLSNRPNGAPPKVQSQPPTGRPST